MSAQSISDFGGFPIFGSWQSEKLEGAALLRHLKNKADAAQSEYLKCASEQGAEPTGEKIVIIGNAAHSCSPALAKDVEELIRQREKWSQEWAKTDKQFRNFKERFEEMESIRTSLISDSNRYSE